MSDATSLPPAFAVDVAVVGAGTAGLAAYRAAAALTPRVLLIEGADHGTTCARVGCMPSKLLIAAAESAHAARDAGPFGIHCQVRVNGRDVMDRVRRERDRFVGFVVDSVDRIPIDHRMTGRARFAAPGELQVGSHRITARAIVVATGSSPFVPAMFEPLGDRLVVNDHVFEWDALPESVAVFGTGVIGLELGQALHRLGVRVRIFGRTGAIGPLTDPVVKASAAAAFKAELVIQPEAQIETLERQADQVVVTFVDETGQRRTERFDYALVAAGRRPNLHSLGLAHAGVVLDDRGVPRYDRRTLQCGTSSLFIAGDANQDTSLLHEAADEGRIAGANAATFPTVTAGARRSSLAIAFTDPEIAIVGSRFAALSERADVVIGTVSFEDQGRSRVMRQNRGVGRLYAHAVTGRFLGAEIVGPRAEHLAHLLAWAHQQEMTVDHMLQMPFYHPVVEEGLRTALRDASAQLAQRRAAPNVSV